MSDQTTLVILLNQAREGDEQARDRLFQKCRAYVGVVARAHVESWLQTKVDASDLVQQTFLDAHRGFSNFNGTTEQEWLAWLKAILSNNAVDYIRHYQGAEKRKIQREVSLDAPVGNLSNEFHFELSAQIETPSQFVIRKEDEIELADAISQLPEDYQEVILLRNLQRLPFQDVAERMGRSRPATQMLWMRALNKLQEIMEGNPE